jgi:hypothetical protein
MYKVYQRRAFRIFYRGYFYNLRRQLWEQKSTFRISSVQKSQNTELMHLQYNEKLGRYAIAAAWFADSRRIHQPVAGGSS